MSVARTLALALVLALTSTAGYADRTVPFRVGEVLTYDVSWSGYVSAGTATLSVRERQAGVDGHARYYVVAEAKPTSLVERLYHLYYKAESFLDTDTLQPSVATVYSDERGRKRLSTTKFLPAGGAELEIKTATLFRATVPAQPQTVDPVAALYSIRTAPLQLGQTTVLKLLANGDAYQVRANVVGHEEVATAIGSRPAWRIALTMTDASGHPATAHDVTLWLSDDTRRLPLRLQVGLPVGNFSLTLAQAS